MLTIERKKLTDHICDSEQCRHVAYIVGRFPKLSETFVLFEMLELQQLGVTVSVFPLLRARNSKVHAEAAGLLKKLWELLQPTQRKAVMHPEVELISPHIFYSKLMNWPVIKDQFFFLRHQPRTYLRTLFTVLKANWGSTNYFLGALAFFPKAVFLARQIQQSGAEHVHAHFANHATTVAYIVHQLTNIPFSFTAHGSDFQVDQHMLTEKVDAADAVITVSEFNREFILAHTKRALADRLHVVRCSVDTAVFHPPTDKSDQDHSSDLQIVCTGTMYDLKGHTYLIEACRILKSRGVEFHCHLIGEGPLRTQLETQVKNSGLCNCITFHGVLPRAAIAAQLQKADVLVVPSKPTPAGRCEGIPVVLMEAMATGLPVVASRISGIPELVEPEQPGLLGPPGDFLARAESLQRLATESAWREELGVRARQRILDDYDLARNTRTILHLFSRGSAPC